MAASLLSKMSQNQLVQSIKNRSKVIKLIRSFFDTQGFDELVSPVLSRGAPAEPTIYPFVTHWSRANENKIEQTELFLPVSPEKQMKRYLAMGFEECYSIGHCFRNLEAAGPSHHPEFLMLEWYRPESDYRRIMADTKALIVYLINNFLSDDVIQMYDTCKTSVKQAYDKRMTNIRHLSYAGRQYDLANWPELSVEQLWKKTFGVSIGELQADAALAALARSRGYQVAGATWEQNFNQLFLNEIEPQLPTDQFYFLLDFPARLSPLCAPRAEAPWLAERFEVYCGALELGNGNSEQLDSARVRQLFADELTARERAGEPAPPLDEEMLAAIEALHRSGRTWAGMGLGVDRLAMLLTDTPDLSGWWPAVSSPASL